MLCFVICLIGHLPWIALASVVKSGLSSGLPEGANAHLVQAEEALKVGDWYRFAREYHWVVHFMSQSEAGDALAAALKRQRQNALSKIHTLPNLDTYTLDLSWLGRFKDCQEDYNVILEAVEKEVEEAERITVGSLLHALGSTHRACTDVRSDEDKLLRIMRELGDALLKITDQSTLVRARSNLERILKEAIHRYPSLGKSPIYSEVLSRLAILRGDELEAIKILWEALKVSKQNVHLMNQLADTVADPSKFFYGEVIKVELSKLKLDAICDCEWLGKFLGLNSWDEAFDAVQTVIKSCECKQGELAKEAKIPLMAFFKAGAFQFDIADSILSKVPQQSQVPTLLKNVKNFKEGLVQLINGTVDNALRKDPHCSLEFLRDAVKKTLDAAYVSKAEQIRESNERRERASKARLEEEVEREERRRKWEEEVRRVQHTSVQRDHELDAKFQIYGNGFVKRDVEKAQKALSRLNQYLAQQDFYNACPSYYEFDWEGDYTEVRGKQVDIKDALDRLGPTLDRGVLCYCESDNYAKAAYERLKREDQLVEKLLRVRNQQGINEEQLLRELSDPKLKDIRDECAKFKDIARLLAKALLWSRAIMVLNAHCRPPTSDDYGDLLGAFSMGLQAGFVPGQISDVHDMLKFIKSHMEPTFDAKSQWGTSLRWRAGLLSIREILKKYVNKSRIPIKPLNEAKLELPFPGLRLKSINRSEIVTVLEGSRSTNWVQLLPLIEEFFKLHFQELRSQRKAWEDRTYLLFKYYTKAKDAYWSFTMLEEAFRCRTSPEEHKSLLKDRTKVEADVLFEIRDWKTTDPQCSMFTTLVNGYLRSLGSEPQQPESDKRASSGKLLKSRVLSMGGKPPTSSSKKDKTAGSGSQVTKGGTSTRRSNGSNISKVQGKKKTRATQMQAKTTDKDEAVLAVPSAKARKKPKVEASTAERGPTSRRASSINDLLTGHQRSPEVADKTSPHSEQEARSENREKAHKVKTSSKIRAPPKSAYAQRDTCLLLDLYKALLEMSSQVESMLYRDSDSENLYLTLLHQGY